MLEELSVRNYALIDSLSIAFEGGLNILTGETGAGKSIIVGALGFLLGEKSTGDIIRSGCEEANVSAVIRVAENNADVLAWLSARDIEAEDGALVVRRNVKTSGRSSVYVQNIPLTRADLAELMGLLFDLHGQHDHETLLRKESHRRYLDRFAGLEEEALAFNRFFLELAEKKRLFEVSLNSERDRDARIELLSYTVDEIAKAALKSGEGKELEAEAQRLSSFEKLSFQAGSAAAALYEDEASIVSLARRARGLLDGAAAIDGSLQALCKRLDDLYYEAEDLAGELRSYMGGLSYNPGRLEEVEERLALLFRLKKKYLRAGGTGTETAEYPSEEDGILAYKTDAEREIEALSQTEENRAKLKAEIGALEKEIAGRAAALSTKRKEAAGRLGENINGILQRLGMPKARFAVNVAAKIRQAAPGTAAASVPSAREAAAGTAPAAASLVCGPWGSDEVEFLFSANAGEPLKELARIASGGELSRVMLAIKTVLAASDTIETLVFDEIDSGIGGEVALAVGEYLEKIGAIKQIFCVTHLASIAVRADNHIKVEKSDSGGRTLTSVKAVSGKVRQEEIARMLAGDSLGGAALAHAGELLARYAK